MNVHPVLPAGPPPASRQQLLFTPGPRLGWVFRDRREIAAPYPEAEPVPQVIYAHATARDAAAEQAWARAWRWTGKPSIALALILVLLAACSKAVSSASFSLLPTALGVLVLCGPGLAYTGWCWLRRDQARDLTPEQEYHQAQADWDQRAADHHAAELARLADQPEWGTVVTPCRRTDIFGGTLAGWQALLTVHGASILAERPLLTIDLTGQHTAGLLEATVRNSGIQSLTYHLPHDLGRCGLLTELAPAELADAIAEALHADAPGGARTDRAVDSRVLRQLTGALARRGVTPRRLAAAARAALGNPPQDELLSADEYELIAGKLYSPAYRQQVTANLVRLEAVLAELAGHAGDGWPAQRAHYTCLSVDTAARSASGEVLIALVAQWLTVQASASTGNAPAILLAGADEITRPQLERLADTCDRRSIPLTLMFRHLRNDAAHLLGGGTAAFMRLANHTEAEQAATYIGRRHTFVVSSFTATRGGNQTSTQGGSDGYTTGGNYSNARTSGWQSNGLLGGGSTSGGRTRTTGTSNTQNWSTTWSAADGTSWSDAETRQRVYEYAVEPATLQNLPEYALLLADRTGNTLQMRAVECDPSIITLPGVSTAPLPPPGAFSYSAVPPAATNPVNPPDRPGIDAPERHQTGWQEPPAEDPEPAWLPDQQQPDEPWWRRNPPPNYRP